MIAAKKASALSILFCPRLRLAIMNQPCVLASHSNSGADT